MLVTLKTLNISRGVDAESGRWETSRDPEIERVEAVVEARVPETSGSSSPSNAAAGVQVPEESCSARRRRELAAAGVALNDRECAIAPSASGCPSARPRPASRSPDSWNPARRSATPDSVQPMPLIVRRRTVLASQVVRVDRAVAERDLIVVGVVVGLARTCTRRGTRIGRKAPLELDEQGIVVRLRARLEVDDAVGTADDRVEHRADGAPDDEVGAVVVHDIDANTCRRPSWRSTPSRHLVHLRVLQSRVDDVDARGAGAGQDKPGERVRRARGERRHEAGRGVDEEQVAGADLDRQRPAVEPALERLNLQRDAIVVDAVSAANTRAGVAGVDQLKPMRGAQLFESR